MQRYWRIPSDRLGIPAADFAAMLDLAARRYNQARDSRYHAAVLATLKWVAGLRDDDPMTRQHRPAGRDAQVEVLLSAGAVELDTADPVFGLTGTVHQEWARGVLLTLGWVQGPDESMGRPQQQPPLRLPRPKAA